MNLIPGQKQTLTQIINNVMPEFQGACLSLLVIQVSVLKVGKVNQDTNSLQESLRTYECV